MTRDELKKEFTKKLRSITIERGMTYVELAEKSGLHLNTLYVYTSGQRLPNLYSATVIADALGVTVDDLIRKE